LQCNLFTNDHNSDSRDSLDYLEKQPVSQEVTHQPLEAPKDIVMEDIKVVSRENGV
jgi:hypothetical protein